MNRTPVPAPNEDVRAFSTALGKIMVCDSMDLAACEKIGALMKNGRYASALEEITRHRESDPDNVYLRRLDVQVYGSNASDLWNGSKAIELCEGLVRDYPRSQYFQLLLADLLANNLTEEAEKSAQKYEEILKDDPYCYYALFGYADLYLNDYPRLPSKDAGDLLRCFKCATIIDPSNFFAYDRLGHIHKKMNDRKKANKYFSIALKLEKETRDSSIRVLKYNMEFFRSERLNNAVRRLRNFLHALIGRQLFGTHKHYDKVDAETVIWNPKS